MRVAMVGLRAPAGLAGDVEGGVEQAVGALAPRLAAFGASLTGYCRSPYNPGGSRAVEGVQLTNLPAPDWRGVEAFAHSALAAPLAAARHDLVHVHAAGPALFSFLPRLAGRRVVVTLHGKDWERAKWGRVARQLLRRGASVSGRAAHQLIAVSQDLTDWCAAHYRAPVTCIPNGVAPPPPAPWREIPGLTPGRYHLFVGRLVPEKGLETLAQALRMGGPKWPVVIVGSGHQSGGWAGRLAAEAPPSMRFLGARFGVEKDALLQHAGGFVLPSLVEGFPLSLLEAMAAGLPVLASDIPPNREALGEGGVFVPSDARAWCQALTAMEARSEERRRAEGAAWAARAAERFSWERAAAATWGVYQRAMSGG